MVESIHPAAPFCDAPENIEHTGDFYQRDKQQRIHTCKQINEYNNCAFYAPKIKISWWK